MEIWHIWVIVALVFVIIEIFTSGFAVMCISIGCVFAALCSLLALNQTWQLSAFALGTILAFLLVRPFVYKLFYKSSREVKTNAEALIGRHAIVTEAIKGEWQPGRVKIDGVDWKAVTHAQESIEVGEPVEITAINSVIVTVKKINQ